MTNFVLLASGTGLGVSGPEVTAATFELPPPLPPPPLPVLAFDDDELEPQALTTSAAAASKALGTSMRRPLSARDVLPIALPR
jgi:hypothetical protein